VGSVDEAENLEAGDAACVFGGLTLGVVEVGRDGDDCLGDGRAEESARRSFELKQDIGADLGWREGEAADLQLEDFAGLEAVGELEWEELQLLLDIV